MSIVIDRGLQTRNLLNLKILTVRLLLGLHPVLRKSFKDRLKQKKGEWRDIKNYTKNGDLYALKILYKTLQKLEPVSGIENRLLYVLSHSRPQSSNGYAVRGHGLSMGMISAGIDLLCLTRPGFPIDADSSTQIFSNQDFVEGVTYLHESSPQRRGRQKSRNYIIESANVIEERIRAWRPQAVMAASNYVTALPALIAARRTGLPFAYEVRGFWEITEISREPERYWTYDYQLKVELESATACAADQIFTLCNQMARELVRRGVEETRIALLPNGCDTRKFAPRQRNTTLAHRIGVTDDVPIIGYIGSFTQYEGLDDLIIACAHLRTRGYQFRLVLVGSDGGPVYDELVNRAEEQGMTEWLILPGRLPHQDLGDWYSLIDIAPFPRKPVPVSELVTPLKPLEMMAMKKAVVVSSVDALSDMVKDQETGLVFEKGRSEDMADCMALLLDDKQLRQRLGKNARKVVIRERTWDQAATIIKTWMSQLKGGDLPPANSSSSS